MFDAEVAEQLFMASTRRSDNDCMSLFHLSCGEINGRIHYAIAKVRHLTQYV